MVPLDTFFILMLALFSIIGGMRGWVKELLVTFSVFLGHFVEYIIIFILPKIDLLGDVPFAQAATAEAEAAIEGNKSWFYVRTLLFIIIVAFGYATTTLSSKLGGRARKEKFQDTLLGVFLGLVNGYLVVGSIWGFLHELNYDILDITRPTQQSVLNFVNTYLPNAWLAEEWIFVLVALSFTFVLIVFV